MISILIPTYQYKVDALVNTLHEQAGRSNTDFEILVYDDGSPHPVHEHAALNELTHVTYRHFPNNRGRSAIRHQLAQDARYELLLFLDADVLPTTADFIHDYIGAITKETDVICGGIRYQDNANDQQQLRFVYGKKRESRTAQERQRDPFVIVTGNLLVRKALFLESLIELEHRYGEDLLLSQQFQERNAHILHIDNPVWHLGLESSESYLQKSEEALSNLVHWEEQGKIRSNFTSLQRAYKRLRSWGMAPLFRGVVAALNRKIASNLRSKKPSLFWFDVYRLYFYAKLKHNA
ncbi:MAG: glycosyltransferase family 2 protein [Bacteroidota bacterium]